MPDLQGDPRTAADARFAILASRWNPRIPDGLAADLIARMQRGGVSA